MCAQFFKKSPLGLGPGLRLRRAIVGSCLLIALVACQRRQQAGPESSATDPASPTQRPLRVAAAADLEPAFAALAGAFEARHGRKVVFSFAGSTALSQQIEHGAPFDLYAAASLRHVEALVEKGRIDPASLRPFARGALVLWTRPASQHAASSGPALPMQIADLVQPQYRRIAVANPEHAPYGLAAVQALRSAGLYDTLLPRLVFGENIRQAHQFVATGNADVAMDARSLAIAAQTPYTTVPKALYAPLLQALGSVRGGDAVGASAFVALLLSDEGQQVFKRFGFDPP